MEIFKNARVDYLRDKFEDKPYHEKFKAIRILSLPTSFLLQLISSICAIGAPSFIGYSLFNNWIAGLIFGAIGLSVFEAFKRYAVAINAKNFYIRGKYTAVNIIVIAAFSTASILSSTLSTPLLVKQLAPRPSEPTEAVVNSRFDSLHRVEVARFEEVKLDAVASADKIHKSNNWRGVTTKIARGSVLNAENRAAAATDSITSLTSRYNYLKEDNYKTALLDYKTELASRENEIFIAGWILAGVSLLCEILFIFVTLWLLYYDFREADFYGVIDSGNTTPKSGEFTAATFASKMQVTAPSEVAASRGSIGFNNEGKIFKDKRTYKILAQNDKRELKPYSAREIRTILKSASEERAEYWEDMLNRLNV
jgi:hypothetical protein